MFDSSVPGNAHNTVTVASIAHVARQARWSLGAPRSYLVPCLIWFTAGQGRVSIGDAMRGFTAHTALFIPANTPHAVEIGGSTQGMAVFFKTAADLPFPDQYLHLRIHGVARQSALTRMIDEIAREVESAAPDSETVLYHQAALLLHWLRRNGGQGTAIAPKTIPDLPRKEGRA